jgi:hypothetical protein
MPLAPLAHVLFDEAHSEAWTIRPELAAEMLPVHPADCSYADAARLLRDHDCVVRSHREGPLDQAALEAIDVLVIAHPSEPRWERTTGSGGPCLRPSELDAIERFVRDGGGLIVLGETEQEKYGNNLNDLLGRFDLHLENETVQDYEHCAGAPSWVLAQPDAPQTGAEGDVLSGVASLCFYRATTVTSGGDARVLARTHASASSPNRPLLVTAHAGAGRIAVLGDSDLFGDDCLEQHDHARLWVNLLTWAAASERALRRLSERAPAGTGGEGDPAWSELREATDALGLLQSPDGSLQPGNGEAASALVDRVTAALAALMPRFPHQADYIRLAAQDLSSWRRDGFGKPDFTAALGAFRPEQHRRDGIEHLAFFPMYKQNGSRDTCFEALVVRVPWPAWIAELESTRYDNPKFVPVQLRDGTRGYRESECAVLFPETVSTLERPVNNFGGIFCDREAERLRRVAGAAVELLGMRLPPGCARMLQSPQISQEAYILWDLIHDRAHSHGELPFDPFMIRQRAPYWMYSLEELRCDLTAFAQAGELLRDGITFARHVQYAILLDRLLRFPITGPRVRNYDGLGGQLLFAHLHRHGYLSWSDNRLRLDWSRVAEGVAALRGEVEELYRAGIDRTKLQHWMAAHDLVAGSVPPAQGSRWSAAARELPELDDPRPYCDLVLADEFPLSIFYSSLKGKLEPVLPARQPLAA